MSHIIWYLLTPGSEQGSGCWERLGLAVPPEASADYRVADSAIAPTTAVKAAKAVEMGGYEDIYRIPAILSAPGGKSRREPKFISLQDFTATFIDIAGGDASGVRGESLMPATQGPLPSGWRTQIVCEFHGHHFPYAQRMIRTEQYVANPEGIDEFYYLAADPDELLNVISVPAYKGKVADLRLRLYRELIARGDKFYQWLAFADDISPEDRLRPETALERFVQSA